MVKGLTSEEAQKQLEIHGFNELATANPKNILHIAKEVLKEPMLFLLISCGILYVIIGNYKEGIALTISILIIIFITFYQYRKTEKALYLLKKLSSPRALVIRDKKEIRIPGREVVPNDIILLNEGDRVVADAIVIEGINLTLDESILTGESLAVTKNTNNTDAHPLVFSGTLVVQGKGIAKVNSTGMNTQIGKIGSSLQKIEQTKTRLQTEMRVLISIFFAIGLFICAVVVFAFYFSRGNFVQSLLNGLAATMSILPEEFPVVLTVFLALGAWRLSKNKVLTRDPSAIENLGAATVLCSDKTGTITQNKMEVVALYNGTEIFFKDLFEEKRHLINNLIKVAHRATPQDAIDPMEKAIGEAHEFFFISKEPHPKLIKEYPLSHELLVMTRVTENTLGNTPFVAAKGAPEAIFNLCKMDEHLILKHLVAAHELAHQGFRVLAVAEALFENETLPDSQHEFEFNFLGIIGLEDPIRPEVPQAIKECHNAGIKVIMITGDFPVTAKSIGQQIGLQNLEVLTGDDLTKLTEKELQSKMKTTQLFARVLPDQKLRIVEALKANNEIVAMTGDGVNDAPALKAAHIGIAMGNKGTDVAREAASLVLLDDNFASIVAAIRSGRRIFDNLQKAMSYITAIHIPIIGLTLFPAFFSSLPILLMPIHLVFIELINDPICSIAFETEQEEKGIMNRPPRNPNNPFFGKKSILKSALQGLLLFGLTMGVYLYSKYQNHTEAEIRAIVFAALIIGTLSLILTNLSKTRPFYEAFTEKSTAIFAILITSLLLLFLILYIPILQDIFKFQSKGLPSFIPSLLGGLLLLVLLESRKRRIQFYKF